MEFLKQFEPYNLNLHGVRVPQFEIDPEIKRRLKLDEKADNFSVLSALCHEGMINNKINPDRSKEYAARLEMELSVVKELEFVDYLLLVWDLTEHCRKENIPLGIGRGSCGGCLILYLIGVIGIDPIKYGLYFERFINRTRAKKKVVDGITYLDGGLMCDIDIDICYYNRPKVIHYMEQKFPNRACKIATLNTLQGKLLIKECGKIIGGYKDHEMSAVADLLPQVFGRVRDLESAYKDIPEFKAWADENMEIYEVALGLRDLIKNKSSHASATMLSHDDLVDSCPLELTTHKELVSAYDMHWASQFNLKLDLLGLRAVSVIDDVCKAVKINVRDIDLEHPSIYALLQTLDTPHGLFQIEADSLSRSVRQVQPRKLEHLSGVIAVCRPGASQFIDQYADFCKTGTVQSVHPFLDEVLGETGNLAIYQEQLMAMVKKIGFSLEEAELIRRATAKKSPEETKKWKPKIEEKIKANNLDPAIGEILWKICEDSANYSFNKSHSLAYAVMAAITCYLKANYPQEFYLSLLKMTRHEPDPTTEITKIQQELPRFGIRLLPPDLLKSDLHFKIEGDDIRFGLLSIKGIADKSIEKLLKFKPDYQNKFQTFHAADEAKLGLGVLSSIIQAGALGCFRESRSLVVLEAQIWSLLTDKEKMAALQVGKEHEFKLVRVVKALQNLKDEKGKRLIKPSRLETIKRHYAEYKEIYEINSKNEALANFFYERKLLGFSYFSTLSDIFRPNNERLIQISQVKEAELEQEVQFMAVVKEISTSTSKKGTKFCKILAADESGEYTVLMFDTKRQATIEICKYDNKGKLPREDDIVEVRGRKQADAVFADSVRGVQERIFTKLADLREKKKEKEKELASDSNFI